MRGCAVHALDSLHACIHTGSVRLESDIEPCRYAIARGQLSPQLAWLLILVLKPTCSKSWVSLLLAFLKCVSTGTRLSCLFHVRAV